VLSIGRPSFLGSIVVLFSYKNYVFSFLRLLVADNYLPGRFEDVTGFYFDYGLINKYSFASVSEASYFYLSFLEFR
jgi:hypothetical protein